MLCLNKVTDDLIYINSLATLVSAIFWRAIYLQNHPKLSYGRLGADEGRSTLVAGFVFQLNTAFATDQILIFIFCKLSYFSEHHTNVPIKLK